MRYLLLFKKELLLCFFLSLLLLNARAAADERMQTFDSLSYQINKLNFSGGAKAHVLIRELYQIANYHHDSLLLRRKCMFQEAELNYAQGVYDSTLTKRLQQELRNIKPEKEKFDDALLSYSLALNQLIRGGYDVSFTLALYAMGLFKELNDNMFISKSLMLLGRICTYIESFSMAEDYYVQAKTYIDTTQLSYYQVLSNIIYLKYVRSNRLDEAVDSLLLLTPYSIAHDKGLLVSNYLNIGSIYDMKGDSEKAYIYLMKAKELNKSIDNVRFSISLYLNIGFYYLGVGKLNLSYHHFQTAKAMAEGAKDPEKIAVTLQALSYIHEAFSNVDSAYYYLKEYEFVKNKVLNNANPVEAYRTYVTVLLEASQKEVVIKEQEILLKNKQFGVIIISSTSIILLIASLVIILYQQKRHSHQRSLLREAENRELEERLQVKQQIEEIQEARIEAQIRELTSYSFALSSKNNILQQIDTAVQRLPKDKTAITEVRHIIKSNLGTDKTWDDFILHFEKVHPSFFNRIKAYCNDISESDLRLCAYFRIGMPAKQIAQILNVTPESIKMHRYRIKKKLGLDPNDKLDNFIRNI